MSGVADPTPIIEARLRELAQTYEPLLESARLQLEGESDPERRKALKRDISARRREYEKARQEVKRLANFTHIW